MMAYEAGARLTGMEHTRRTMLIKDANIPLLAITITRGGRMLDIYDNIVMEWSCHDHKMADAAFKRGHGPLRIRVSHLPEDVIQEIEHVLFTTERPSQQRFFEGRGIDFRKSDIELWPTENQLCGGHAMSGIVVNERAETDVAGLYAAGDVACVPKQHLTGAFVFGEVAAENAVDFISSNRKTVLDTGQVEKAESIRNRRFTSIGRQIDVSSLEYKVRRLVGDYVVSPKNAYKLNRWFEWSERFQEEVDSETRATNGHELSKIYEIENIVSCACFCAGASLERKESRWGNGHSRTDYPERDDENWLCHLDISRGDHSRDMRIQKRAIQVQNGEEAAL